MKHKIKPTIETLKIGHELHWPNGDVWKVQWIDADNGAFTADCNGLVYICPDNHPAISLPCWYEEVEDSSGTVADAFRAAGHPVPFNCLTLGRGRVWYSEKWDGDKYITMVFREGSKAWEPLNVDPNQACANQGKSLASLMNLPCKDAFRFLPDCVASVIRL